MGVRSFSDAKVDDALHFLRSEDTSHAVRLSEVEGKALARKIDWMLMLLVALVYNLQYLDKTIRKHLSGLLSQAILKFELNSPWLPMLP